MTEKDPVEEFEDKIFDAIQASGLRWTEEVESLFNMIRVCVAYYLLKEKSLSERELAAFLEYQKERVLAILEEDMKKGRSPKMKSFGDKRKLK
jgi:hypothetical protein